jgi:EF hand
MEARDDMGRKMGGGCPGRWAIAWVAFGCWLLAGAPQLAAQSFSGMGLIDLEAARDSFFNNADRDGDFALSSEEQLAALGTSNSALFECSDSDGDGICSYSEFLDSGQQVFDTLDIDGDGNLTTEELQ